MHQSGTHPCTSHPPPLPWGGLGQIRPAFQPCGGSTGHRSQFACPVYKYPSGASPTRSTWVSPPIPSWPPLWWPCMAWATAGSSRGNGPDLLRASWRHCRAGREVTRAASAPPYGSPGWRPGAGAAVDALASTGDPAASVESVATAGAVVGHRMAILSTAEAEAGGAARGAGVTTDSNLPKKPTGMSTSKRSEQQETF